MLEYARIMGDSVSHIRPDMSTTDKILALSASNIGAANVCLQLSSIPFVDFLELLDKLDLTGDSIYMLWNDVCLRDIDTTCALLIACSPGVKILARDKLMHAINNRGAGVDVQAVTTQLMKSAGTNKAVRALFRQ